jgi:hypothetical protein
MSMISPPHAGGCLESNSYNKKLVVPTDVEPIKLFAMLATCILPHASHFVPPAHHTTAAEKKKVQRNTLARVAGG